MDALDDKGESPLIKAAYLGFQFVVEILLAAGADANLRGTGPSQYSALDRAAQNDHVEVLEKLLEFGAAANSADHRGVAAIHVAALHGATGAVDALIKAGADITLKDHRGWTPLLFAARGSNHEVLRTLLEHGAAVNKRAARGTTPLHQACALQCEGMEAAVTILLEWGADKKALDNRNRAPVDMIDSYFDDEDGASATDSDVEEGELRCCSEDEIDRVRKLLSGAAEDVAWRRRSWLVMLRSRVSKSKVAIGGGGGSGTAGVPGKRQKRKELNGGEEEAARVRFRRDEGAQGSSDEAGDLGDVVGWLAELEREALFRAVLGYL